MIYKTLSEPFYKPSRMDRFPIPPKTFHKIYNQKLSEGIASPAGPGNLFKKGFHGSPKQCFGFTLVEIVIVIALASFLLVTVFQALDRVKENEIRFDTERNEEKEIYLLFDRLSGLFKNMSSFAVFNNLEQTLYFHGTADGAIFLSRSPLMAPYPSVYLVEIRFREGKILYREKPFRQDSTAVSFSFDEMKEAPFYTLLEGPTGFRLDYYIWDEGAESYSWETGVDSFEKDPLPLQVSLRVVYKSKEYSMLFQKVITDKNEEIPPQLLH